MGVVPWEPVVVGLLMVTGEIEVPGRRDVDGGESTHIASCALAIDSTWNARWV